MCSPRRRASSWTSATSVTLRPLLLAACFLRGGLRFLVEPEAGAFAGMDGRIARADPLSTPAGSGGRNTTPPPRAGESVSRLRNGSSLQPLLDTDVGGARHSRV